MLSSIWGELRENAHGLLRQGADITQQQPACLSHGRLSGKSIRYKLTMCGMNRLQKKELMKKRAHL